MAGLILRKEEFFPSATQAVAVADRYPQNVFAEHTHEFCELVLVWRGNGLHVLNDRPGALPAAICSTFAPKINTPMLPLTIWFCRTSSIARSGCSSILTGPGRSGLFGTPWKPHWRMGSTGMAQARQVISQLEHECARRDAQGNAMAELLFAQLALTLQRHRYATDDPRRRSAKRCWTNCWPRWRPALAAPLFWSVSASRRAAASGRFASSFASKPG